MRIHLTVPENEKQEGMMRSPLRCTMQPLGSLYFATGPGLTNSMLIGLVCDNPVMSF